ncbi:MAG: hypothetical protein KJZ93_20755 [Caldilineaceae bacterium]|nr:hypothetical protein [Caldilineaceae bacterium]
MSSEHTMTLQEIIEDIHALSERCEVFERKYGVLSETFYESLMNGEEPPDEDWFLDWSAWAGAYKVLLRRREQYRRAIGELRQQIPSLSAVIEKTAHREPLPVAA